MMPLPQTGSQAPAFSLPDQDGNTITLSDFAGRYVLLWWYPKADTPGWTVEGKGFRDRIRDFDDNDVVVLGVSTDTSADNKAFREKFDFPFKLLSDVDGAMSAAYGALAGGAKRASRVSVLIDRQGRVHTAYEDVQPAEHPAQVLQTLAAPRWSIARGKDRPAYVFGANLAGEHAGEACARATQADAD